MPTSMQRHFVIYVLFVTLAALLPLACSDDDSGTGADTGAIEDTGGGDAFLDSGEDVRDAAHARDAATDAPGDARDANDTRDTADANGDQDTADTTDAAATTTDADTSADAADTADATEPSGDTCQTAIDVSAGGTWPDQSTVGANDDYDSNLSAPNCPSGSFSGNDRVYLATPATLTEYKVTVEPVGSFDPFIYVRASCSDQACMAGTVLNGSGESESVTFELQANETGHIIVDGELGDSGDYTLTVEIL